MPDRRLLAGAATSNITPPLGCSLAGSMTDKIGLDVHDELHVRGLVLDNGQTRLAFAVCDSCAIGRDLIDRAKHLINSHTGIPMTNILVSATHTHSAPAAAHLFQSPPDPSYQDWLVVRISDAVRLALHRAQPARIGWGMGREERLVFNRRFHMKPGSIPPDPFGRSTDRVQMNPGVGNPNTLEPAGPIDPDVGMLAVETPDGKPIAVLGNYALHYVGDVGPGHISADYFAAWAQAMNRLAGGQFVAVMTNACSGNINAVDVKAKPERLPFYTRIRRAADLLSRECYRVWRDIRFQDWVELSASTEDLELGVRLPPEQDIAAARKTLADAPGSGQYKDRTQIYARETLILNNSYPKTVQTVVQALRIGSLGIATLPGEAFVELGMEVKEKSPFKPTFLIELANDYRGYLPTVEGHEQGGYETWRAKSSYLEKEAAPKLVASALRQLGKMNQ
ncbi:MAG: hypothetical protein ABIZ80_14020 [Bryobacteraceae bacterium]